MQYNMLLSQSLETNSWFLFALFFLMCLNVAKEIVSMIRALAHVRKQDESKSKARLEAALWEGRVNQYKEIVRVFVHLTALGLIGLQTHALLRPSFAASLRLAMGMFAWILHHSVISETFVLNKRRLRLVNLILHFATGIFMYNLPGDCASWCFKTASFCLRRIVWTIFPKITYCTIDNHVTLRGMKLFQWILTALAAIP